ncbi:hypothetical protein [Sphingomonas hankookensis]
MTGHPDGNDAPLLVELVACPGLVPSGSGPLAEMRFRGEAWTPAETETLRSMFAADAAPDDIAAALGRGRYGVRDRIARLGLRRHSSRPWGEMESEELIRRYGTDPTAVIASDFARSCAAIYARAAVLGLTEGNPPEWTPWEDAQLRAGYAIGVPGAMIAAIIGRPLFGLRTRASTLNLRHPNHPTGWSDAEIDRAATLIEEGHRYVSIRAMMADEGFPVRTRPGFNQMARVTGMSRGWGRAWTPEEDELLARAYRDGASLTPLLTRLGRTRCSIRWRADHLRLRGTHAHRDGFRGGPVWTEADLATLREHYGKVPMDDLAACMGRTKASLFTRANLLGLVHGYHRPWSDDEHRALALAHANGVALADLVAALGRGYAAVHKYAAKQGFRFERRPRRDPAPSLTDILALGDPE